jgi:MoxR-like ATPase
VPRSPALTSRTLIALGPERLAELLLELGRLTEAAPLDPATLAEQVFEAFCDNGYGVFDGVIGQLKQALEPEGLALLKSRFEQLAEQPDPVPPRQEWQQVGWGSGGPTYAHEREESSRQWTVKLGLQDVTTAMGDIDAYIAQYTPEQQGYPRIAAGIPQRHDEAQAARWNLFARCFRSDVLRDYLDRLPAFEDAPAELMLNRRNQLDGDHYTLTSSPPQAPAADGCTSTLTHPPRTSMTLKPADLMAYLRRLVDHQMLLSTMIWGPPGIGKSSIVAQVAEASNLAFIDVRLSQLAPTDLRGLPVAIPASKTNPQSGISAWYPPEFLPREGRGILFLDELNMAPPAMQGVAQQLILDRRVGSYEVPDGWFIWAAGNRKEDRASVFEMPAPLANRFLHLSVGADFDSFKAYALNRGLAEPVLAFLSFRSGLLHQISLKEPAWPSPRSWEMASRLHLAGLDVDSAVGEAAASEFRAYLRIYDHLPNLERILGGKGAGIPFPEEASSRYATTLGLTLRASDADQGLRAFEWLVEAAPAEWVQLFASDLIGQMRRKGQLGALAQRVAKEPQLQQFLRDYRELLRQ